MSPRYISGRFLLYLGVAIVALWVLAPIILVTFAAFTPRQEIYQWPRSVIPSQFSLESIRFFLSAYGVLPSLWNSILVALLALGITLAVGAPAGYAVARYAFRGRDAFRLGILVTRMFPTALLSIPLITTFTNWGLYDTLIGVAFIHAAMGIPFAVLITTGIFASVSRELEEAAMTLGCSRLGAFMRVALPLALPGLAAAGMFTFIVSWNEVFAASVLTVHNRTLPATVLAGLGTSPLYYRFAGGFIMIIPAMIFMFFARRYLLQMWGGAAAEK